MARNRLGEKDEEATPAPVSVPVSSTEAVVIDIGGGSIKFGWAGEDRPRGSIPTLVATERTVDEEEMSLSRSAESRTIPSGSASPHDYLLGKAATAVRHSNFAQPASKVKYVNAPLARGEVQSWDQLESILWHVMFHPSCLGLPRDDPSAMPPVLFTQPPMAPSSYTETLADLALRKLKVPSLAFADQAVMSLYSTGRTSGLVLELGSGVAASVPVFEGLALRHATKKMSVSGADVTDSLLQLLSDRYPKLLGEEHLDIADAVKHSFGKVRLDPQQEVKDVAYELPDGNTITVQGEERSECCEVLFEGRTPLHSAVIESLTRVDADLCTLLKNNVVLAGGTSMLPGLGDRLLQELANEGDSRLDDIHLVLDSQRRNSAWIGGSMVGSMSTLRHLLVTAADFHEDGHVVHRRSLLC